MQDPSQSPPRAVPDVAWQFQDRLATAFDEVRVLDEMGREGWELTGFGPFLLHFRRPEDPARRGGWEHRRITEFLENGRRFELERDGWTHCGSWFATLHYYKRPAWRPTGDEAARPQ